MNQSVVQEWGWGKIARGSSEFPYFGRRCLWWGHQSWVLFWAQMGVQWRKIASCDGCYGGSSAFLVPMVGILFTEMTESFLGRFLNSCGHEVQTFNDAKPIWIVVGSETDIGWKLQSSSSFTLVPCVVWTKNTLNVLNGLKKKEVRAELKLHLLESLSRMMDYDNMIDEKNRALNNGRWFSVGKGRTTYKSFSSSKTTTYEVGSRPTVKTNQ